MKTMGKRNYTCYDYEEQDRIALDKWYEDSFKLRISDRFCAKELEDGQNLKVKIVSINDQFALGEGDFGQAVSIDLQKEEKAIKRLGYPALSLEQGSVLDIVIYKDRVGNFHGSISAGYEKSLKDQLTESLMDNKSAYLVTVESLCPGGFMVNLSGIKCFLPGSLAAANRILDFSSYVGKQIMVMVETYDEKRDIFVVSFKKYLRHVIEHKVQDLSFTEEYLGTVTGTSAAGVFVEWNEFYTGLIPAEEFINNKHLTLNAGDSIKFRVLDLKNSQRIVLTLRMPDQKLTNLQKLKDSSLSETESIINGTITKIKNFGIFVKIGNTDLQGLVPKEDLLYSIKDYEVNKQISVIPIHVDLQTSKINLREAE